MCPYSYGGGYEMLTKDEQKAQKTGSHNYSLDDVLLGKRVKIARKEKRLTQEELASLCDCTPTHICNIENGKIGISLDLLFKISIPESNYLFGSFIVEKMVVTAREK